MKSLRNTKGITLIALVITIVVLLILAGVSIAMLTGDNGILTKASSAKEKSAEEEARERVKLMIAEWKIDNAIDRVTIKEYLESTTGKYYEQIKAQGIESIDKSEDEDGLYYAYVIVGGQKYYVEIYIGNESEVTIGEVLTSINVIGFSAEVTPQYVFVGNVDVTITATAPEGNTISSIELQEGSAVSSEVIENAGKQTASRKFTLVSKADNEINYIFTATDNEGNTKDKTITIKTLPKPEIEIEVEQEGTSVKISITNSEQYPQGIKFRYYVGEDDTTGTESTESSYTKTGLTLYEEYAIKVKAYYNDETINYKYSNTETIETKVAKNTLAGETTDYSYKNPVIPQGFYPLNTDVAKWEYVDSKKTEVKGWNEGLVITDVVNGGTGGNEFVWVPVDGTIVAYTKNFSYPSKYSATSSNTSNDTSVYPVANENTQIERYGGFYVARYEAGCENENVSSNSTSPNNSATIVPVSKKGTKILNNISYANAAASAKLMINNQAKYGNNKSGLITGTQWDTIMDWYNESGIGVIGSSTTNTAGETVTAQNWGTYRDLTYSGTGNYFTYNGSSVSAWQSGDFSHTGSTSGVSASNPAHYHASGLNSAGIKKNIADLGGNVWEWTAEVYSSGCVNRGGGATYSSTVGPASCRDSSTSDAYFNLGFRVVLYIQ